MSARARLSPVDDRPLLWFWCTGCQTHHAVSVERTNGQGWAWNRSVDRPTLTPSIKVTGTRTPTDDEAARILAGERLQLPTTCCHSYVADGRIQYLDDCTHHLKGQTVDLEPIAESMGAEP